MIEAILITRRFASNAERLAYVVPPGEIGQLFLVLEDNNTYMALKTKAGADAWAEITGLNAAAVAAAQADATAALAAAAAAQSTANTGVTNAATAQATANAAVPAAAGTTNALTAKATVVDGDVFAIEDSAAGFARKKTLFSTVITYIFSVSRTFLGAIRQTPTQFAFSTTPSINASLNNSFQMTDIVTADFALTLTGGQDGDCGTISFKQAAAGGKKITGITVSGRTVLMRDDLTTINTGAMLTANAKVVLDYQFLTAVDAVVLVGIRSGVAAAFT
jgi:hypothetical protein